MEQHSERPDANADEHPGVGEGANADEHPGAGKYAHTAEDTGTVAWDVEDGADAQWGAQEYADAVASDAPDADAVGWDAGGEDAVAEDEDAMDEDAVAEDGDAVAWDAGESAGGGLPVPDEPEQRPATGEPRVDAALARLDELSGRPVTEHRAIFEDVHRRLRDVLGELDTREQNSGEQPAGAGAERRADR